MASVGTLTANLIAKTHGYTTPMGKAHKLTRQFGNQADRTARQVANMSKNIRALGVKAGAMGLGLATAGFGLAKLASQAEETQSKFNVVFRGMAVETNAWAEQFASDVGRANRDVKNWMAGLQDTFVPLGFARDQAAELSKSLTTLAVDVASFNNVSDASVIDNFKSAIVGSHRAVLQYGIVLNQTTLQEELRRMGITKSWNTVDEATKAQARYNLILASTRDAQGDAIRTGNSFQNQLKALSGDVRNLGEDYGNRLLAPFSVIIGWVRRGVGWFGDLDEQVKNNIIRVGFFTTALLAGVSATALFATAFLKTIQVLMLFGKAMAVLASPIVLKLMLIAGAAWLLYRAWEDNWGGIRETTETVWAYVEPVLSTMWDWLQKGWKWSIETAGNAWKWLTYLDWQRAWETVKSWMSIGWSWSIDIAGSAWNWMSKTNWQSAWESIKTWMSSGWTWSINTVGSAWAWLVDNSVLISSVEDIRQKIVDSDQWQWVIDTTAPVWGWIFGTTLSDKLDDVKAMFASGWNWVVDNSEIAASIEAIRQDLVNSNQWQWAIKTVGEAWDWIWGVPLHNKLSEMKVWFALGWSWIISKSGEAWDWIWGTSLSTKLEDVKSWFNDSDQWEWAIETSGKAWQWFEGTKLYAELNKISNKITDTNAWKWAIDTGGAALESLQTLMSEIETVWKADDGSVWEKTIQTVSLTFETIKTNVGKLFTDDVVSAITGLPSLIRSKLEPVKKAVSDWAFAPIHDDPFSDAFARGLAGEELAIAGHEMGKVLADTFMIAFDLSEILLTAIAGVPVRIASALMELGEYMAGRIVAGMLNVLGENVHIFGFDTGFNFGSMFTQPQTQTQSAPAATSNPLSTNSARDALGIRRQYAAGGYTGNLPVDQFAGFVHGQELVVPAPAVKGGLEGILRFLGLQGYQDGKGAGVLAGASINDDGWFNQLSKTISTAVTQGMETLLGEERFATMTGWFDTAKDEIQGLMDSFDYIKKELEDFGDVPEEVATDWGWNSFGGRILDTVIGGIYESMPMLKNAIETYSGAIDAGASPMQALTSSILGLMMQSEGFRQLLTVLNGVVGSVANMLGSVFGGVARVIASVWNALLDLISLIPFVDLRKYKIALDDTTAGMDDLNKSVSEAVRNVPRGFKINQARVQAAAGIAPMSSQRGSSNVQSSGDTIIVNVLGDHLDKQTLIRDVKKGVAESRDRANLSRYGTAVT